MTSGHQRRAQKDYWQLSREFEHYLKSSYRLQENLNLPSVLLGKFEQNLDGSVLVVFPFMNSIIKKQVRNWLSMAFLLSIWRRAINSVWQPFHNGSFALFFFWLGVSVKGISNFLKSELLHWKLTPTSSFTVAVKSPNSVALSAVPCFTLFFHIYILHVQFSLTWGTPRWTAHGLSKRNQKALYLPNNNYIMGKQSALSQPKRSKWG